MNRNKFIWRIFIVAAVLLITYVIVKTILIRSSKKTPTELVQYPKTPPSPPVAGVSKDTSMVQDTARYNALLLHLAHEQPNNKWPVKAEYPLQGALLPYHRIVAFYGNLYTPQMGILGRKPADSMLAQLTAEVEKWQLADSTLPVIPALHYIAVTAQSNPGKDGKYRLRMPGSEIEKVLQLADSAQALVFLDIQPGWSSVQEELPLLKKYLLLPNVHVGIDPEYSMKNRRPPCTTIGTMDAADINYAINWLDTLVQTNHLSPKILVVHRFTEGMVTNYKNIKPLPTVQVVMDMDGFGGVAKKKGSYQYWIAGQPVQFTGFKLFYKNDIDYGGHLMEPAEVLELFPQPVYIQYQ
ncbi:hypothetical protein CLV59_104132 [Chitinophaga dinghuensis]|uniref:Lipoprotein n=1 Tax=Chitinophaga dinghuensis TaxID=1539050 RepID=A0A327VY38_9BACT|nr:hypothetical protein [Chitinophaga dinghuensis]RAJ81907.1 hypothetical protein CLV59_104132 [Chitinophaga dinghuensis]